MNNYCKAFFFLVVAELKFAVAYLFRLFLVLLALALFSFCILLFSVIVITFETMSKKNLCKILSLNVRGIRDCDKRRSIFSFLKDQKATFYFLQETYSDPNDESFWKSEWGGNIIFSHGLHRSRGVCILIDPSVQNSKMKMKSRIDFFLVANHLRKYVHKADIQSSIAPDHNLVCVLFQWENEITRGPGFWKFK